MAELISVPELCKRLTEYGSFLLFTHSRPDGDTLGSALGLKRILESTGRRAEVVCADRIPARLCFLTETDDLGIERLIGFSPKCYITVDVADFSLLGRYKEYADRIDFAIDHHSSSRLDGNCRVCVDDTAAACGEIVYEIGKQLESDGVGKLDKECAEYLYCAISSDTGGFAYSNTTPKTHRIAAELLEYGIDSSTINDELHNFITKLQLEMQAEIIDNMRFYSFDRVVGTYITEEMRLAYGMPNGEDGDIVNLARGVPSVEIAFSVKEACVGEYRVSFRSKHVDVSVIAAEFGGGGHSRAAGCSIKADDIEQCLDIVSEACTEAIEHGM